MRTLRKISLLIAILTWVGLLTSNPIFYTLYYLGIILSVLISQLTVYTAVIKNGVEENLNIIIIGILLNSIITILMGKFSSGMTFKLILIMFAAVSIWQANNIDPDKKEDYIVIEIN